MAVADHTSDLRAVRAWSRAVHPPPGLWQRLDTVYTTAVVGAIVGALVYGTASSALAQVVNQHRLGVFGPSVALVALLLCAQWGAFQGPVVFTVADVAFLLGSPLSRRALALSRLLRSLALGAVGGAVVASLLLVGLHGLTVAASAGLVLGLAELAVLGVAAAWAVQRSARCERAVRLATWPVFLVAAALAAGGRTVALWSGPWGWALPTAAGAGRAGAIAALAALSAVTAASVGAVLRDRGRCSTERHLARAQARAGAVASLMSFDVRTARRALDAAATDRPGRSASRLGWLRRGGPIVWRDAVAFARVPGRVAEAIALVAAGSALALLQADEFLAVAAGMLIVYVGAARLLWPLRAELDAPDRTAVLLRQPAGHVVLAHTLLPAVTSVLAAAVAATGCAVAGALPAEGPAAALAAIAATPAATACAAMSARRGGRLPQSLVISAITSDPTGGGATVTAWLVAWPLTAAVLGSLAVRVAARGGLGAAVPALAVLGIAVALLARLLARGPARP